MNARYNSQAKNLFLFQGDIFNIPFKDKSFDLVFCLGVIQHTPDPSAAFISLASKVKKGGFLYIDVYTQSWYHYLHWKYILRPLTKRMNREKLYRLINFIAPKLIPFARFFRKCFGRAGARLIPIVEFSHLGLSKSLMSNGQFLILLICIPLFMIILSLRLPLRLGLKTRVLTTSRFGMEIMVLLVEEGRNSINHRLALYNFAFVS